jgi:T-complex protein 1 subunit alpha
MIKSSLGPTGLDKMLVDEIGDVTVTNDGATILAQMEVEHPAARLLVDLAQLQDKEVGDGTTSVVLIAAELLRRGNDLVRFGNIHPTTVLSGYRLALKAAIPYLKSDMIVQVSTLNDEHLLQAAATSMSSKIIGAECNYFARLAVDAVKSVETSKGTDGTKNKKRYPLSAIHILKAHGKSLLESELLRGGFALQAIRASQAMPSSIPNDNDTTEQTSSDSSSVVKIAMLDMNLQRHRMAMGITITVKDPAEVENIKKREMDITKEKIQKILATGARVILTTKGIDDLCMKYFVEANALCCRRVNRDDLFRLAKATGGKVVTTMADMDGNESFDIDSLGTCDSVREVRVGDGEMLHFYNCHTTITEPIDNGEQEPSTPTTKKTITGASTIILRGANEYMLDEMDRALHDALCVVKRMLESNTLVPGGGACEAALSVYLEKYAVSTVDTREQLAIIEFAEALLVIPKTLAVNAAKDSSELVAQLRSIHAKAQSQQSTTTDSTTTTDELTNLKYYGLDLMEGEIRNNLLAGVVEPAVSKIKALRFATEAAITILRIDDRITVAK